MPQQGRAPERRRQQCHGWTVDVTTDGHTAVMTIDYGPDQTPRRVDVRVGQHGSSAAGAWDALGAALSVGLQAGVPPTALGEALHRIPLTGTAGRSLADLLTPPGAGQDRQ